MAIPKAREAMIIYYRRAEKCSVAAIARKVNVSRTAVQRVLALRDLNTRVEAVHRPPRSCGVGNGHVTDVGQWV
jgi:hypothetical protein